MAKKKRRSTSASATVPRRIDTTEGRESGAQALQEVNTSVEQEEYAPTPVPRRTDAPAPRRNEPAPATKGAGSVSEQRKSNGSPTSRGSASEQRKSYQQVAAQKRRRTVQRSWLQRNPWALVAGIAVVVALVVGIFFLVAKNQTNHAVIGPSDPAVLREVTSVKANVLASVGTGGLNTQNIIQAVPPGTPPLTGPNGKPAFFYYGAEFCPYCAAQRWSVAVALSRFGTFSQLPLTASSSTDTNPNTATFSFNHSQYSSQYIDFTPVEAQDRNGQPLQNPSSAQQQLLTRYKVTGFPFIDVGEKYIINGPLYSTDVLTGFSQKEIADKLKDPNDDATKNIVGAANYLTAAICVATNNQPTNVCTNDPIPAVQNSLPPPAGSTGQGQIGIAEVPFIATKRQGN